MYYLLVSGEGKEEEKEKGQGKGQDYSGGYGGDIMRTILLIVELQLPVSHKMHCSVFCKLQVAVASQLILSDAYI